MELQEAAVSHGPSFKLMILLFQKTIRNMFLFQLSSGKQARSLEVLPKIEGQPVSMELDTRAAVSEFAYKCWWRSMFISHISKLSSTKSQSPMW